MPAVHWWLAWGAAVPELQSVALKVLSQPISVGGVERVWSIFGWIQNKLWSKMLPATAKKLVMVHIMWLKIETMKESGKWEADLLQHTDEDLTWEQLTRFFLCAGRAGVFYTTQISVIEFQTAGRTLSLSVATQHAQTRTTHCSCKGGENKEEQRQDQQQELRQAQGRA
jgi:hypothetical protein